MTSNRSSIPRLEVCRKSETSVANVSTFRNSVQDQPHRTSRTIFSSIPRTTTATSSKASRQPKSPRGGGARPLTPPSSRPSSEASTTSTSNDGGIKPIRSRKSQLLTPTSGVFRSRTPTPAAPRHAVPVKRTTVGSKGAPPLPTPHSPYLNAHCADACTVGSLLHCLSPCGHKVITKSPEACASNCQRSFKDAVSQFANVKKTEEQFVCATCVDIHIRHHYQSDVEAWNARFEETERRMGGFPPGWMESQMRYSERVLENDLKKERDEFEKLGRPCYQIPGAPLELPERRPLGMAPTPAPWPPRIKPKGNRSLEGGRANSMRSLSRSPDDDESDC